MQGNTEKYLRLDRLPHIWCPGCGNGIVLGYMALVPRLLDFFIKRFSKLLSKDIKGFTDEALNLCVKYSWPGNVRELVNAVEYAINLEENPLISLESLPSGLREEFRKKGRNGSPNKERLLPLAQLEKDAIIMALEQYGWTDEGKTKAAQALGSSRATIYRKIQKYKINPA